MEKLKLRKNMLIDQRIVLGRHQVWVKVDRIAAFDLCEQTALGGPLAEIAKRTGGVLRG